MMIYLNNIQFMWLSVITGDFQREIRILYVSVITFVFFIRIFFCALSLGFSIIGAFIFFSFLLMPGFILIFFIYILPLEKTARLVIKYIVLIIALFLLFACAIIIKD